MIKSNIPLHPPFCYNLKLACQLARQLPHVVLRDVLCGTNKVLYRPIQPSVPGLPLLPGDLSDLGLHTSIQLLSDRLDFCSKMDEEATGDESSMDVDSRSCNFVSGKPHQRGKMHYATDGDGYLLQSPWVLILHLDRVKCIRWGLTPSAIADVIYPMFAGKVHFCWSSESDDTWRLGLRFVQHSTLGRVYTPAEELLLTYGRPFEKLQICRVDANYQSCEVFLQQILKTHLSGIPGIHDAAVVHGRDKRYQISLEGKNLQFLVGIHDEVVNGNQIQTNDPTEYQETFGVLQAQQSLFNEVLHCMVSSGVTMHTSHLKVLAALMCSEGSIAALNRTGIGKKWDIVSKICFEDPFQYLKIAFYSRSYELNTSMGNIVMSQPPALGTNGRFSLRKDEALEASLLVQTEQFQKKETYNPVDRIFSIENSRQECENQKLRVAQLRQAHKDRKSKRRVVLEESLACGTVDHQLMNQLTQWRA